MSVRAAFLALAACIVLASAPAIGGSWVYDDRLMVGHPMLDGFEDVAPAFGRTSADYLKRIRGPGPAIGGGSTYRPLPMVSLVLVNAIFGLRPLAHHLVSLLGHLGIVYLLLRLGASAGRVGWKTLFVVTIFALHPVNLEAYGWINARADVMAGVVLAAVLHLVSRPRGRWHALALFAALLVGALCKETFLLAAAVPLVAWRLRPFQPRALGADLAVFAAAVLATIGLRVAAGAVGPPGGVDLPQLLGRFIPIVRLTVETWVVPWPHAMRLLAWETSRALAAADIAAAALVVLVTVILVVRGELRRGALIVGAFATLLPVLLVADAFWLGFDRYLYLPGILVVAAVLPAPGGGRVWAAATLGVALVLGAATFHAAGAYRSHTDLCVAILSDRPDEPTGFIIAASDATDRGQRAEASALLDRMPADDLPAPLAHAAATELLRVGRSGEAAATIERVAVEHPDDANLKFDLLTVRGAQGRWPEVIVLVRGLAGDPARRRAVGELVDGWMAAGVVPADTRARLEAALSSR